MRHFSRSLNSDLFKYRKRKKISLNGYVPGVSHSSIGLSKKHVSGMPHLPGQSGNHHDLYMGNMPQAYHPSLNAPAVQEADYEPYEPFMPHTSRPPMQPRHNPHNIGPNIAGRLSVPDDDLTLIEQLRLAQDNNPLPTENIEANFLDGIAPAPGNLASDDNSVDTFPSFPEVADALEQLSRVLPPDHQDLINLRMAAHEWLGLLDAWSQGLADPHEAAAPAVGIDCDSSMPREMFDSAMAEQQMMPEPIADTFAPMQDAYDQQFNQGLEAIVQEAIPQQDPFEMQQRMYDEEMLMLMNPFMTPRQYGPGPIGP